MKRLQGLVKRAFGIAVNRRGYPAGRQFWPSAVRLRPKSMACGAGVSASLIVTGFPAEVAYAWLDTLTGHPGAAIDVSLHVEAVDEGVAMSRLQRRRSRLEAARRHLAHQGRLDDPAVEAACESAADLAGRLARGETRLHQVSVYITVHAASESELADQVAMIRTSAAAALLDVRPASFRQWQTRLATLPLGMDLTRSTRTVDTAVAAASFPLASPDAPAINTGVLYGLNLHSGAPVWWDRWQGDNHNSVVVARSGAGKSYFSKCEILRQLYDGVHVSVIDPDGEYLGLAQHVGGTITTVGDTGSQLNPLALPAQPGPDALARRKMVAHTLVATMLGGALSPDDAACLDDALTATYAGAGITDDSPTCEKPAPVMADLQQQLTNHGQTGRLLAHRIAPYTVGALSALFTGTPETPSGATLRVFNLRDLPDELHTVGVMVVLDAIWNSITDDGTRRLVVIDEAWLLLRQPMAAAWLSRLAKTARKRLCGLTLITQDADDMLNSSLGHTVIANAATQILLRQAPQSLDHVAEAFGLSEAERDVIATARRGEALLLSGEVRAAFRAVASDTEHSLCLTGMSSLE